MPSGPPPQPSALKILKGNPGQRPIEPEPEPEKALPLPPSYFTGEALAEWGRIVGPLFELGLVTVVDRAGLIAYCEAWDLYCSAMQTFRDGGSQVTIRGERSLVKNPCLAVAKDALDSMLKYGSRFGMTPSDRVRLTVPEGFGKKPKTTEEDAALRLLS